MSEIRTIRVTGKGKIRVRPDMTRITLSLEGVCPDYGLTLSISASETELLKDLLTEFGFERSDLKTLNFRVDTKYERKRDTDKQRFVGYEYYHQMKVEFDSDNDRLGKLLYALAHCPAKPEFRISYTVKDQEAAKNELLGKAVADAKEKAVILTQAAGVSLNAIQSIDYSWGQITFESRPVNGVFEAASYCPEEADSYDIDIDPDDIEVSDTVTVIWEIGQ